MICCVAQVQNAIEARSDMTLVKPSSLQSTAALDCGGSDAGLTKPARMPPPSCRRSTGRDIRQDAVPELRLSSGSMFRLELTGDVEIVADDQQQHYITYHEFVDRCCRQFTLVPKSSVFTDRDTTKVLTSSIISFASSTA